MNIMLVTPYFPDRQTIDSGLANHYLLLAQSLACEGNAVVILHIRPRYENEQDEYNEHILANNITVLTFKVRTPATLRMALRHHWAIIDAVLKVKCMLVAGKALGGAIKRYHIDVVETSSYFSLCYFTLFRQLKVPVAVRVSTTFAQMMSDHYPFRSRGMDLVAAMEITLIKRSKYLITHAKSHAGELERLYAVDKRRFEIIPHAVDLPDLRARQSSRSFVKILYTGRFEYRKGTDILLAAIPLVLQEDANVLFELAGNDPNGNYQRKFIADNPAAYLQHVSFKGKIDQASLAEAYCTCDIFVAPSRYESFGIVFIEAMSYGKPVVGCPVGGVADIITDHYNGLFADTGDAESLAHKILILVKNEDLRKEMGRNGRKTVEDKFTKERLAANSMDYYYRLLADFKA